MGEAVAYREEREEKHSDSFFPGHIPHIHWIHYTENGVQTAEWFKQRATLMHYTCYTTITETRPWRWLMQAEGGGGMHCLWIVLLEAV